MTYTVYGTPGSRAFRVLWMLEELDQPYDHVPAAPRSDAVRAVSALGKVPVLVADGVAIPDSMAILTYLADHHGSLTFPAGSIDRARQDALSYRILDEIESLLWTAARHSFILPEDERVADVKPACRAEYDRNLTRLIGEMDGPYLMGETMTVPDILLCHCGGWARSAKFPDGPEGFGAYLKRLRERPAFKAAAAR